MTETNNLINFELPGTTPVIEMDCTVQAADMLKPVKFKALWERLPHDENSALSEEIASDRREFLGVARQLREYDAYGKALERGEVLEKFADIDGIEGWAELQRISNELEERRIDRITRYFRGVKRFPADGGKKIDILPDDPAMPGILTAMLQWDHYIEGLADSHESSTNTAKVNEAKAKN